MRSSNLLTVDTNLPSDIGDTCFKETPDRVNFCLRESLANGITYHATEAYAFGYQHCPGDKYLMYMSDADGFENKNEIVKPGIIPNMSNSQGHSYQGCGLVSGAGLMVNHLSRMKLVIASHCKDGHFAACAGQIGTDRENQWKVTDVTDEWYHILLNILGNKRLKKYSVYYAFQVDLLGDNLLDESTMANLQYMCPQFLSCGGIHDPENGIKMTFSRTLIVNK